MEDVRSLLNTDSLFLTVQWQQDSHKYFGFRSSIFVLKTFGNEHTSTYIILYKESCVPHGDLPAE
jgi:hypothetical protein